jgi:S-ribosylhomocysteine lyase LuxS involved in autoinducer biosynthesis
VEDQSPDLERLGDPDVAKRIGLARDQREEIARLLSQRAQALAETAGENVEQRAAIVEASDKKLLAVLTDVQRGDFLGQPVEKRLRFMFRYQQWKDVLQWLAEQAEMSLVMDAPPPGTFNYSDTREYTPEEAIDMLNGVLIVKGYTLVRRGRMLMLIDLSEGLPEGLVFQVPLESLDKFGKFEFVTVQFDLGRRSPESVEAAIKPLLTPYHKIVMVPATRQVFVTDRAGVMTTVEKVIEALPEPKTSPPPPTPATPEPPVVEVYPITKADPEAAMTVLKALVPTGNIVLDPKLNQINAHATPSQQAVIKEVLERMEAGIPEEARRVLEVHPIGTLPQDSAAEAQLIETLKSIVPQAQLSWNADRQSLVAWATAADQETIKSALEKLNLEQMPQMLRQVEVHRLQRVDPATTLTLFQTILPDARLAVDNQTRKLIAVAVPADQEVIRSTLKILEPAEPSPDTPELRYYELTLAMPPDLPEAIQKVSPGSIVALDQSGMRLMVIASPSEHAKIEKTIQTMQKTTFIQGRPQLAIYEVTEDQRRRFDTVWPTLSKELPQVTIIPTKDRHVLSIWARPRQHEVITEILEELKSEIPDSDRFELATYSITVGSLPSVTSMLETLYPETKFVPDPENQRLMVWTSQQQQESIKASLEKLQATGPAGTATVEIYPLTRAEPTSTLTMLQSLLPEAKLSLDQRSENLVAMAVPEDHQTISTTLAKLQPDQPGEHAPRLLFYEADKEPSTHLMGILQNLAPRAQITYDAENQRLSVMASPADHNRIEETLSQFYETQAAKKPVLATYPLRAADATDIVAMLEKLYPDLQFLLDAKTDRLLVWGSPDEQASIKESLEKLLGDGSPQLTPQLEVHRLTRVDPDAALALLQKLLPEAQLTLDVKTNSLMVLAVPADQQVIRSTLEQLQTAAKSPDTPVLRFHPLSREPSTDLVKVLQDLVPQAEITADAENERLTVVASEADHEQIRSVIEQFEGSMPPVEQATLRIYPAGKEQQQRLTAVLTQLAAQMPGVQVLPDASRDELAIWAKPTDHLRIAEILDRMASESGAEATPKLAAYSLKAAEPSAVAEMLGRLFPDVEVMVDENTRKVMVWAPLVDQARVSEAIQQIDSGEPTAWQQEVRAYPLGGHDPKVVIEMLTQSLPKTRFSSDPQAGTILAWGTVQDHQQIAELVEQLTQTQHSAPKAMVYDLKAITAASAQEILQTAVPQAKLTVDAENPQRLTAWARPFEHDSIAAILQDLDLPGDRRRESTIEVYTVPAASIAATSYQIQTLATAFPKARFSPGGEPGQIVAWASAEEHEQIRALVERMKTPQADETPTLTVYTLRTLAAEQGITLLQAIVPDAKLSADPNDPQRLTAWAKPADHQTIQDALRQIDGEDTDGDQSPHLEFYALDQPASANLVEILEDLAPRARITLDAENQQLAVVASPADHDRISATLQQLHDIETTKDKPALTVYPFRTSDPAGVLGMLKELYPGRQILLDAQSDRLLVWASAEDQASIKESLDKLLGGTALEFTPQLEVHRLLRADPQATLAILQKLLPDAQLSLDAKNNLIALAVAADQRVIKATLEQLQTAAAAPDTPVLRFHPLSQMPADNLVKIIQEMVPQAQITADVENERLTVVATPEDHETITRVVAEYEASTPPAERATLTIYPVTPAQQRRFELALAQLTEDLPSVQVLPNAAPGELAIWATPTDHAQVAEVLKRLSSDNAADDPPRLAGYTLKAADPNTVSSLLTRLFPDADIVIDEKTRKVMVWAPLADQARISEAIQQIDSGEPGDWQQELRAYPLRDADPTIVVQMLTQSLPEMRFSSDPKAGTLLAWGTREDHQQIQKLVEQLTQTPDTGLRAAVYDLKAITAASAQSILQTAVPQAKLTIDPEIPQRLTAWARAFEHESIAAILQEIDVPGDTRQESTVEVYSVPSVSLTGSIYQIQTLSTAFPKARFSLGGEAGQIVAWASPKDHEQIKTLVARMKTPAAEDTPSLAVYTLEYLEAEQALEVLQKIVTAAELTLDPGHPKRLTAWAKPAEHETIKNALAQIDVEEAAGSGSTAVIYTLDGMDATAVTYALQFLTTTVPNARITRGAQPDQLLAWATARDHEQLRTLVEQLTKEPPVETAPKVAVYTTRFITAANASSVLATAVPRAKITVDAENPQRMTAWANPSDHQSIASILEEIDIEGDPQQQASVEVYTVPATSTTASYYQLRTLATAFPQATFSSGAETGQIIAWASAKDHEQIRALIQRMKTPAAEDTPTLAVYTLEHLPASQAQQILAKMVIDAELTIDPTNPQRLTAWAKPAEHETIKNALAQIDVEEAAGSGSTAVIYTLDGMDATAVTYALQFLTTTVPNARITRGAQPDQLLAWATARDHEQLRTLIEQLTKEPPVETAPKVAVYTTRFITAANASSVLVTAVPRAKITVDPDNPQRMTAWATPSDHQSIASILEELDIEGDPQQQASVEVYTVPATSTTASYYQLRTLATAFPQATFSSGAETGQLIAWASAKDHEQIRALIQRMKTPAVEDTPTLAVYTLEHLQANQAQQILAKMVIDAELTIDPANPQRLTAWATPVEHETIKNALAQIDVEDATGQGLTAVTYTFEAMDATAVTYALQFLTTAVPTARITRGVQSDQLVAWATPRDHQQIQSLVDQLTKKPAPELAPRVAVYSLQFVPAASAVELLQRAVPKAEFTTDATDPGRLIAWASPADQETIKMILSDLDVEGEGTTAKVEVYRLEGITTAVAMTPALTLMTTAFPNTRFSAGTLPGELVAWGSAKDHAEIKQLVDRLNAGPTEEEAPQAVVYSLKNITAATALTVLTNAVPRAKLSTDVRDPQRLIAWASPADQATIKAIVQQIDVEGDPETSYSVQIYTLEGMSTRAIYYAGTFLASVVPQARFTPGAEEGQMVVWATAKDHEQIRGLIQQMTEAPPSDIARQVAVYSLQHLTAASAVQVLSEALPRATLTTTPEDPQRLTAWATPADHKTIEAMLEKIDIETDPNGGTSIAVYRLSGPATTTATTLTSALRLLTAAFPRAQFSAGLEPGQLLAWATPKDHQDIQELVDRLNAGPPADEAPVAAVYSLKNITAATAQPILASAVPMAKLSTDTRDPQRLTAWASPVDQATIKAIVEQIDVAGDPETSYSVVIYTLEGMSTRAIYYAGTFLASVVPQARYTPGSEEGQMVVWATAKDHEQIRGLIQQMTEEPPPEIARQIAVYSLQHITAADASEVLETALPRATITTSTDDPQRLTVWASPSDQEAVEAMLQKIDIEVGPAGGPTVAVYRLQGSVTPTSLPYAMRLLTTAFPRAQFSAGIEPNQLLAWASARDHEGIQELIDRLNAAPAPDEAPTAAVYTFKNITAASAQTIVASAVPMAKLSTDVRDPQRLTAWASPVDQATIKAIVEQIDVEGDPETSYSVQIYTLEGMSTRAIYYAGTFLASVVPQARFTPGSEEGQMVVWATAKDHEQIRGLIQQMTEAPPPELARQVAVYSLQHLTAESAVEVLSDALPRATLTTTPEDPQRLTAWATPADHKTIEAMLEKIDIETDPDGGTTIAVYRFYGPATTTATTLTSALKLLTAAFPRAQFSAGIEPGQLLAWATPKDHQGIQELVDRLNAGPPADEAPRAVVYTLKNINATTGLSVLTGAVPQAKLTTDASDPQRLTAWATPADHENIQAILQEIDVEGDVESGRTAVIYSLEEMDLRLMALAYQFLSNAVPDARFSPAAQRGQILAFASARDHQRIAALVEQLTQELPPDQAPTAAVYTVKFITATTASDILSEAVPRAKFIVDATDTSRLTVWANPTDQATIKSILGQIDIEGEAGGSTAEVYLLEGDLTATAAAAALRLLATAFPNARFSTGTDSGQIVAWASEREHAEISDLIDRINAGPPPDKAPTVVVYTLEFLDAAQAQSVLQTAVPNATCTLDAAAPQRLTVWATPTDHQTIEEVLGRIDVAEAAESELAVVIYSLRDMSPTSVTYVWRFLANAVPNARLTPGAEPEQLVAWASPKDHKQLAMLIDQLTTVPPEDEPKAEVYTTQFISAANAVKTLQLAVPRATLTPDDDDPQRMTVLARPADHDNIKAILAQIDIEGDSAGSRVEVYQLQGAVPTSSAVYALRLLATAFPRARFSMGTDPGQLVAWASVRDHAEIDELIERLNAGPPPDKAPAIVVYALDFLDAAQVRTVLQAAVPNATLTLDPAAPQRLTAWATPDDHQTIETVLGQIDVEEAAKSDLTVVVYSLRDMNPRSVPYIWRFLASAVPSARLTPGAEPEQLVAWASARDHEQLAMLIEQLTTIPPEDEPSIAVYTTRFISAANASSILAEAVPRATLTPDADDPQRLTAWARATDHANIKMILQEIDVEGDADAASTVEVYALQGQMTAASSAYTLRLLGTAFPRARVSMGTEPGQIVVWATPRDHDEIRALIDRLNAGPPEELAPKAEIYTLQFLPAADALTLLQRAVPGAVLTPDPRDPQRLTAWATPLDHRSINEVLQQLDVETDPASAPTLQAYTLEGVDAPLHPPPCAC